MFYLHETFGFLYLHITCHMAVNTEESHHRIYRPHLDSISPTIADDKTMIAIIHTLSVGICISQLSRAAALT